MARKQRILVADDDEMVRMVMRAVLAYQGYQVEEAVDGAEALHKYHEASEPIDLVMMDLNMPVMNGKDALHHLLQVNPGVKAVLLTGGLVQDGPAFAKEQVRYLQKPFLNDELVRLVGEMLPPG
jgi:CheY-like chemotaxis protein